MQSPTKRAAIVLLGVFMFVMLYSSCRKLDTPYVVDEDNIMLYLEKSEDGHELFRTKGLYSDSPYTIAGDSATYRLIVDSVKRKTYLTITPKDGPYKDYNLGTGPTLRDAELVVDDVFHARQLRIAGIETTTVSRTWGLTRKGFFLKLGADDREFVGWKLWAFNGGFDVSPQPPVFTFFRNGQSNFNYLWTAKDTLKTFHVTGSGDTSKNLEGDPIRYETDHKYIRIDKTPVMYNGEKLGISASTPLNSVEVLLNGRFASGDDVYQIKRPSPDYYIDSIFTSTSNQYHWSLFTFMERRVRVEQGVTYTSYVHWCVPYRVAL